MAVVTWIRGQLSGAEGFRVLTHGDMQFFWRKSHTRKYAVFWWKVSEWFFGPSCRVIDGITLENTLQGAVYPPHSSIWSCWVIVHCDDGYWMNCPDRTRVTRKNGGWGAGPASKDVKEMNGVEQKTTNFSHTRWGGNWKGKMLYRFRKSQTPEMLCSFVLSLIEFTSWRCLGWHATHNGNMMVLLTLSHTRL